MKKLKRIRLKKALNESFGAWKDNNHSELREETDALCPKPQEKQPPFTREMKTGEFYITLAAFSAKGVVDYPGLSANINKQV